MKWLGIAGLAIALPVLAAPRIVAADGRWAVLQQDRTCEAASRSVTQVAADRTQPRAAVSFDAGGPRRGQFSVRFSRPLRPGSTAMLVVGDTPFLLMVSGDMGWSRGPAQELAILDAMRSTGGFRVEARSAGGARMVERYSLDGAPLAIDAAAACAARLANR